MELSLLVDLNGMIVEEALTPTIGVEEVPDTSETCLLGNLSQKKITGLLFIEVSEVFNELVTEIFLDYPLMLRSSR
jgi:hypothetical protein